MSEAVIGEAGPALVEAIKSSSSLQSITIGKDLKLPLKEQYESETLDAAGKGIESGGATVIAWWMTTSAGAVAHVNLSEAIIGEAGHALVEGLKSSSFLESITIGKGLKLPLKEKHDSETFDAVNKGIESGGATVIAWWLSTRVADAVKSLTVSSTGESSRLYTLTPNIEKINLESINVTAGDAALIGEWCRRERWVVSKVEPGEWCAIVHEGKKGTALGYNAVNGGITMQEVGAWLKLTDKSMKKFDGEFNRKFDPLVGEYADKESEEQFQKTNKSYFELNDLQWTRLANTLKLLTEGVLCDQAKLQELDYDEWLAELKILPESARKLKECEITKTLPVLVPQYWRFDSEKRDDYKSDFEMQDDQYERFVQKLAQTAKDVTVLHEKVRWDDDGSESDWIPDAKLEKKQEVQPLEVAIQRVAPIEVLRYLAESSEGLEAKNSTGVTFHDWLLGHSALDYHEFAQTFGTFRPRHDHKMHYKIISAKVHGSATCVVIFAIHVETGAKIALKLMVNRDEWLREQEMRKTDGGEMDGRHVLEILHAFELDDEGMAFCKTHSELKGDTTYSFLLALPAAERDLSDLLSHDQIAGRKVAQVASILRQVGEHLLYLHSVCKRIHGDCTRFFHLFLLNLCTFDCVLLVFFLFQLYNV